MEKHCNQCEKENIGCTVIQKMLRDVADLKKSRFWKIALISSLILVVGLVGICIVFWRNLLLQPIMLAKMDSSSFKDVAELFNNQFANMLTLLGILMTIFGFILPLINLFYQRQTLKDERESLQHEVDLSLEIIKEQVKEFKNDLSIAREERRREFGKIRSELAEAIQNAKAHFQDNTNSLKSELKESKEFLNSTKKDLDAKIATHDNLLQDNKTLLENQEKKIAASNGYFMQQLALTPGIKDATAIIYFCNALPFFSKYVDDEDYKKRLLSCISDIKGKILLLDEKIWHDENFTGHIKTNLEIVASACSSDDEIEKIINDINDTIKHKMAPEKGVQADE